MASQEPTAAENPLLRFGAAWNRFWYAPQDAFPLALLRIVVGLIMLYWLAAWTPDLVAFFGPRGLISTEVLDELGFGSIPPSRLSYLSLASSATELYVLHAVGLVVVLAFTLGVFTRFTSIAALVVAMAYIHRAEFLTSQSDTVMVILLFYLCLGPCGRCLSFDRWRAERKQATDIEQDVTWTAAPSLRLIQIHLTLYYVIMVVAQLTATYIAGPRTISFPWIDGTAVWWLAARPDSRWVDLTGLLGSSLVLINAVTHLLMLFEVVLIAGLWRRSTRRFVLWGTIPFWLLLAVLSGLGMFAALMCAAGIAFVEPGRLRRLFAPLAARAESASPAGDKKAKSVAAAS